MNIGIDKTTRPSVVHIAQLLKGQIGRVSDSLYVMRCEDHSILRIWPDIGEIDPLNEKLTKDLNWQVEIMPVGSKLTFTVTE